MQRQKETAEGVENVSLEELVNESRTDEQAYSELIARTLPLIKRIAAIYQQSPADCDDLVSEGILGLLMAIKTYSPDKGAKFTTYACKCARNRMLNAVKKASAIRKNEDYTEEITVRDNISPEKIVINRELLAEVFSESCIKMSPREKDVLSLYLLGYSYDNIAKALKINRKAVDNALARVRQKLRTKLS